MDIFVGEYSSGPNPYVEAGLFRRQLPLLAEESQRSSSLVERSETKGSTERRKIQNRIAQRIFLKRKKEEKEQHELSERAKTHVERLAPKSPSWDLGMDEANLMSLDAKKLGDSKRKAPKEVEAQEKMIVEGSVAVVEESEDLDVEWNKVAWDEDIDGPITIRCICGYTDDKRHIMQCEKCGDWQHIACYYETAQSIVEIHECARCSSRNLETSIDAGPSSEKDSGEESTYDTVSVPSRLRSRRKRSKRGSTGKGSVFKSRYVDVMSDMGAWIEEEFGKTIGPSHSLDHQSHAAGAFGLHFTDTNQTEIPASPRSSSGMASSASKSTLEQMASSYPQLKDAERALDEYKSRTTSSRNVRRIDNRNLIQIESEALTHTSSSPLSVNSSISDRGDEELSSSNNYSKQRGRDRHRDKPTSTSMKSRMSKAYDWEPRKSDRGRGLHRDKTIAPSLKTRTYAAYDWETKSRDDELRGKMNLERGYQVAMIKAPSWDALHDQHREAITTFRTPKPRGRSYSASPVSSPSRTYHSQSPTRRNRSRSATRSIWSYAASMKSQSTATTAPSMGSTKYRRNAGANSSFEGGNIRLRIDPSAPLSLQFNGDMEGRTLRVETTEDGTSNIIIGQSSANNDSPNRDRKRMMGMHKLSRTTARSYLEEEPVSAKQSESSKVRTAQVITSKLHNAVALQEPAAEELIEEHGWKATRDGHRSSRQAPKRRDSSAEKVAKASHLPPTQSIGRRTLSPQLNHQELMPEALKSVLDVSFSPFNQRSLIPQQPQSAPVISSRSLESGQWNLESPYDKISSGSHLSTGPVPQKSWSDRLKELCQARSLKKPTWRAISEIRGRRTAWSAVVDLDGQSYAARQWYTNVDLESAMEDAAEVALKGSDWKADGKNYDLSGLQNSPSSKSPRSPTTQSSPSTGRGLRRRITQTESLRALSFERDADDHKFTSDESSFGTLPERPQERGLLSRQGSSERSPEHVKHAYIDSLHVLSSSEVHTPTGIVGETSKTQYGIYRNPTGKVGGCGGVDFALLGEDGRTSVLKSAKETSRVSAVAFLPDGNTLASASDDWVSKLLDTSLSAVLQTLKGFNSRGTVVTFSPGWKTLSLASADRIIKLWDASWGVVLQTLEGHTSTVNAITFSPDGKMLASVSWDGIVKLWDTSSGAALQTLKGYTGRAYAVVFSPDGKILASKSRNGTIRLWDTSSGTVMQTLRNYTTRNTVLVFSPDGKVLASPSAGDTIKLWDASSGAVLQTLEGHTKKVDAITFSPDGKTLASVSWDRPVKLWDVSSGGVLQTLEDDASRNTALAFSPDGKTLASTSWDRIVKLWDISSDPVLHTLKGHTGRVYAVAFSPDGKMLASASEDETVKLWDACSGAVLQTLDSHIGGIVELSIQLAVQFCDSDPNETGKAETGSPPKWTGSSFGRILGSFPERYTVWEVNGPAKETTKDVLVFLQESMTYWRIAEKYPNDPCSFTMSMVGRTMRDARLTLIFSSRSYLARNATIGHLKESTFARVFPEIAIMNLAHDPFHYFALTELLDTTSPSERSDPTSSQWVHGQNLAEDALEKKSTAMVSGSQYDSTRSSNITGTDLNTGPSEGMITQDGHPVIQTANLSQSASDQTQFTMDVAATLEPPSSNNKDPGGETPRANASIFPHNSALATDILKSKHGSVGLHRMSTHSAHRSSYQSSQRSSIESAYTVSSTFTGPESRHASMYDAVDSARQSTSSSGMWRGRHSSSSLFKDFLATDNAKELLDAARKPRERSIQKAIVASKSGGDVENSSDNDSVTTALEALSELSKVVPVQAAPEDIASASEDGSTTLRLEEPPQSKKEVSKEELPELLQHVSTSEVLTQETLHPDNLREDSELKSHSPKITLHPSGLKAFRQRLRNPVQDFTMDRWRRFATNSTSNAPPTDSDEHTALDPSENEDEDEANNVIGRVGPSRTQEKVQDSRNETTGRPFLSLTARQVSDEDIAILPVEKTADSSANDTDHSAIRPTQDPSKGDKSRSSIDATGVVVGLLGLVWDCYNRCRNDTASFHDLEKDYQSLATLLYEAEKDLPYGHKFDPIRAGCKQIAADIEKMLDKYAFLNSDRSRRSLWQLFRWSLEDIEQLSSRVIARVVMLNASFT
jgi:WD40 repeat protein